MSRATLAVIFAVTAVPAGFIKQTITINQKVDGKYSPIGTCDYVLPTLAAFGYEAKVTGTDEETGWPVYERDFDNWVLAAIDAQIKSIVRNRIDNTTATLKPGAVIPMTLAEITAETERSGAALKIIAEAKRDFASWVASLGKSAAAQALLTQLFANKQAIQLRAPEDKAKFQTYLTDFAASLEEDKLLAYQRYIDALLAAAQTEVVADDF